MHLHTSTSARLDVHSLIVFLAGTTTPQDLAEVVAALAAVRESGQHLIGRYGMTAGMEIMARYMAEWEVDSACYFSMFATHKLRLQVRRGQCGTK